MLLRRLLLLYAGLVLYGVSAAMMLRAGLGLDPWNVLHQGIALHLDLSFGTVVIGVGAILMLLWIPLRERPGMGTISNVLVIGLIADVTLSLLPQSDALFVRFGMMVAAVILKGIATGMYIGAGLGPGPRDGLMTGMVTLTGWSIRKTRTGIEAFVLAFGWLLGGTIGVGTVLYAVSIGSVIHVALPVFQAMVVRRATVTRNP